MKCLLILLAASLTASDKLDRTYLPPPGAQFAGGNPGDILAPLETPNLPQTGPIPVNSIPNQFNEYERTGQPIQVPVTTTSYAFSQTTTFPIENFETTAVPINPITGLPIQNVGPFSNLQYNQPGLLGQKQGEILIGGPLHKQPISNQPVSGTSSVKYPGGQLFNENINQPSGIDGINTGPIFQTTEAVAQVQDNQYPDAQNNFNTQGPSTISAQANILPNNQYNDIQNQEGSPEYVLPNNPNRQSSLDIMQPYLDQDNQNEGAPISGSASQQPFPPKNSNIFNQGSILPEKNNYQSEQVNDEVHSTTPSFTSSVSRIHSGSHPSRPPRPQTAGDRNAVILKYDNTRTPNGYSYSFETSNGIRADESGIVDGGTKAQGSYSYTGDDGKVYSVFYTADENGFQPHGDHLPTSPPIPDAIREVIEQAARDEAAGIFDDGSYDENKYGYKNPYLPESQRGVQRSKVQRKKIQPTSNKKGSQQLYDTSDISDTKLSGENYPSSENNGNNDIDENNNSRNNGVRGSYFSKPNKNEENSSYLDDEDSAGHISDSKPYTLQMPGEYTDPQNNHDSRNRYPTETGRVEGSNQNKPQGLGSAISSTNKNIDRSNNGDNFGPSVYDNDIISQDKQPKFGQALPSQNQVSSENSNRRQNEYQMPINSKNSEILKKGNAPQAAQVFNRINIKESDRKRIDTPSFTDYNQGNNNQGPINQENTSISQLSENGYYYNAPQNQFDHTEFPTRFKAEEESETAKQPLNKNPTPFLTPEVHNQPSIRKKYKNDYSTTPQPFMTSRVITHKDDSNPDYENDKDYIFDEDTDEKDVRTTTPGDIVGSSTRRPNQPSSQPSRHSSTETGSKNTKSQQSQRPNSFRPISSNNRNTQTSNYKYPTATPVHNLDETVGSNYSPNIVKPSLDNHISTESKSSRYGPVHTGKSSQNTPEYQTRLETTSSEKPESHEFSPISNKYQNQPARPGYTPKTQNPERFDFESIPGYYQNINEKRPIDYSGTRKIPSKLDKPGTFILSGPGSSATESSPIGGQGFTPTDLANTILSSTPSNFLSPISSNSPGSQISQSLPPKYKPTESPFSTTASPSTIGTAPNIFIPSTLPGLLPEVYSTTPQYPSYFSPPDTFHQNPIVDGFGKPIIPELRSVFSTPGQGATPNTAVHYAGGKDFRKPEEPPTGLNNLPLGDGGRETYNGEQSPTYPEYDNPTKVIGEDFSGPKQPQRYDAQTGYHYK